jgi:hypothetical protein
MMSNRADCVPTRDLVLGPGLAGRGERVSGVAKIVNVQSFRADRPSEGQGWLPEGNSASLDLRLSP